MRTTLELDDRLHAVARRRAFEERRSIGEIVSELALRGLAATEAEKPGRPLGRYRGLIRVADDFDDTPAEVTASIDEPLA